MTLPSDISKFLNIHAKASKLIYLWNCIPVTTTEALCKELCESLIRFVNGRVLAHHDEINIHTWIVNRTSLLTGAMYSGLTRLSGNLLPIQCRQARERPNSQGLCDSCSRPELLGHILQQWPRTHSKSVKRHDKIDDYVHRSLNPAIYETQKEPCIPTDSGIRKLPPYN